MLFFWLLLLSSATLQLVNVTATASLLVGSGPGVIPALWALDVLVTLAAVVLVRLLARNLGTRRAILGLTFGFGVLYAVLAWARTNVIASTVAYVLADAQFAALPTVIWAAAAETFASHEARTLFPKIAAGSAIGNLVGALLAAAQPSPSLALGVAATICVVVMILSLRVMTRAQPSVHPLPVSDSVKAIREVPSLRALMFQMVTASLSLALLEAVFLTVLAQQDSALFATIYGLYRFALFTATALTSGGMVARLLNRMPAADAFIGLPSVLAISSAIATLWPMLPVIIVARFVSRLMQRGWDEPARRSFTALLGDQRRAGIAATLDTGGFSLGTLGACVVLAAAPGFALVGAIGAGILSLIGALLVRNTYQASLLDWRFKKSRRSSVLDRIEF